MAPYTYYYFFSIITAIGTGLYLINLALLRLKGRTTFGLEFKPGTSAYKRVVKLASTRNLIVFSVLEFTFLVSFLNSLAKLLALGTPDARFILIFAPVATILGFILMGAIVRHQIGNFWPGR